LKALLAQKDNSRDQSPASNILKALLARKKQFEGPKPCLEYLEGAAGPKKTIRNNFDQKFPRRSKHSLPKETHSKRSAKDRVVEKPCVIWVAQKRGAPKPRREPSREIIRMQGVHTFEVRKNSYQPRPLSRKESACPKNCVIADDMLP
jgi:hypothetical protein